MAENYQVGNLEIAFKAIDQTSADFKKLKNSLQAIQRLIGNIANADISKFSANIKSITADLSPFLTKIQEAETSLSAFANISQQFGIKNLSKATTNFNEITQAVEETTNETREFNGTVNNSEKILGNYKETINKVSKELNDTQKATKKAASGWTKFIKSIGRIALYRAIRRALQLITQSITESIQEFAKLDDNINDTVSRATSSLKIIQLSFGATFLPLLQAIGPILSSIAVSFADFANTISQAMATGDTYWSINAKAIKDYREQLQKTTGTLASFDKIQSLNQKDEFSFFEEKEVDKQNEAVQKTANTIQNIKDIIKTVGEIFGDVWNSFKPIIYELAPLFDDGLSFVKDLLQTLRPLVSLVLNLLNTTLIPIIRLLTPFVSNVMKQIIVALNGVMVALIPVAYVLEAILKYLQSIIVLFTDLFTWNWSGLGADLKNIWSNWASNNFAKGSLSNFVAGSKSFAQDFVPDRRAISYANSAGANAISYNSSVQGGDWSSSQTEQAFYNALVRYGRESSGSEGATIINIDGQRVFEAVQRNANKRGLGFSRV